MRWQWLEDRRQVQPLKVSLNLAQLSVRFLRVLTGYRMLKRNLLRRFQVVNFTYKKNLFFFQIQIHQN